MNKQSVKETTKRKYYLDVLRVLAVFFVIYAHSGGTGSKIYLNPGNDFELVLGLFLDCFRCINNCLFLMISGALLLGKNEPIKKIYKHRVLRMTCAIILFSLFYEVVNGSFDGNVSFFIKIFHTNVIVEFWFMYHYIGYLILLPLLRAIAQRIDSHDMKYIIGCFFVFNLFFSLLYALIEIPTFGVPFLLDGFLLYPLIGFYLDNSEQTDKMICILGIMAVVGLSFCMLASYNQFISTGSWTEDYIYRSESVCGIFIFILIKRLISDKINVTYYNKMILKLVSTVSASAFGIYFIAPFLQGRMIPLFILLRKGLPVIPSNFLYIVAVIVVGTCVTLVLKKLPGIRKVL